MKRVIRINTALLSALGRVLGMNNADLMEATGIRNATWYRIMGHPDEITVQQLISIANGLCVPVRRFFSFGDTDMVGSKDDYVLNQYQSCYYDGDAILNLVNTSSVATWMDVAKELGMTRANLRHSLLLDTRLPVARFLSTCEYLGLDPFLVIVDPNPRLVNRREQKKVVDSENMYNTIIQPDFATIQREMASFKILLEDTKREIDELNRKLDAVTGANDVQPIAWRTRRIVSELSKESQKQQKQTNKLIVNDK